MILQHYHERGAYDDGTRIYVRSNLNRDLINVFARTGHYRATVPADIDNLNALATVVTKPLAALTKVSDADVRDKVRRNLAKTSNYWSRPGRRRSRSTV